MVKPWEDMTVDERFAWLWHQDQSTQEVVAGISARLDEVGGVIIELEKQIRELQASIAGEKGRSRPMLKL